MRGSPSGSKILRAGAAIFGAVCAGMGLVVLASVSGCLPTPKSFTFPKQVMAILGAGVFVSAGLGMLLFGLGAKAAAARLGVIALLVFVVTFNWIAFGPGERNFTRKIGSRFTQTRTFQASEIEGRAVFGIVAGVMDLLVIYGLIKAKRHKI
jgi:hypothetical protein